MSSGNLIIPSNSSTFWWNEKLDHTDYLFVTYRVTTTCDAEKAAIGMAMEQSASTQHIHGYVDRNMVVNWTIRICSITPLENQDRHIVVDPYFFHTEVYAEQFEYTSCSYDIILAIPTCLVQGKPTQLLNVLVGELPRLGFLTSFWVSDIQIPQGFCPGPACGAKGILNLLDRVHGPLLCRSMRPGVGLDTDVMAALNRDVLVSGFHLVKDDELICFADHDSFTFHLRAMLSARDEAIEVTGEKKLYIANLICEPEELEKRWKTACDLSVDGVLVAPFIQGLGVVSWVARQAQIPVLAHNSFTDLLTRNRCWGIGDVALCSLLRHLGTDWLATPGAFATEAFDPITAKRLQQAAIGEKDGI